MSQLFKRYINEKILPLMYNPKNIRNCTIIAHIDHGKTTLVDSLLAEAGLISPSLAAELRFLDYDKIEQDRGITIKAANASIYYKSRTNDEFVINIIDTPGHIDFSGHVTRSLRVSDGAVVVIDAVEGVMVQTETVTRQALEELVKPTLFINKVDRLIKEKKLSVKQLLKAVNDIILDFNLLIQKYGVKDLSKLWQVSFARGTVAIGSAKDKWGIIIYYLVKWGQIKNSSPTKQELFEKLTEIMSYIYDAYEQGKVEELATQFPVSKAVLEMVVEHLPNPVDAQKIRVPRIWKGDKDSELGKAVLNCDNKGPVFMFINDLKYDPRYGFIASGRLFSGEMRPKLDVFAINKKQKFTTQQLAIYIGKSRIPIMRVPAGNIVSLIGVKEISTGETIVDAKYRDCTPIEELRYVSEPVVTFTVEPARFSEFDKIQEIIAQFAKVEPNIQFVNNPETGELLLSGVGELQIEVFLEKLKRYGVEVELGKPVIIYKESIKKCGPKITLKSKDNKVEVTIQTDTMNNCLVRVLEENETISLKELTNCGIEIKGETKIVYQDRRAKNILIDINGTIPVELNKQVITAFKQLMKNGPLVGEQCYKLVTYIHNFKVYGDLSEISLLQINNALKGIYESMNKANPIILEPFQLLHIVVPEEYVGEVTGILNRREGKVLSITQEKYVYKIKAEIPVRTSFGLSKELRTVTRGYATWGAEFLGYKETNTNIDVLISEIKQQKGFL